MQGYGGIVADREVCGVGRLRSQHSKHSLAIG